MFIVYSDMFRLTRVIFRLELYLFAMSLCLIWDPRRLYVFLQKMLSTLLQLEVVTNVNVTTSNLMQ